MKTSKLTEGKIFNKLVLFSLPMIAGNMLQQVYNLVDTFVVGRFIGADALAAVGSAYTLMIFITSVIIGLCMGSGAYFSADFGGGRKQELKQDIWLSFWFILAVSMLISFIVYPAMDGILKLLRTPAELMEMTREYVSVVFAGIIFVFLYNFFAFLLRAMGNSKTPLMFLAISAIMNIVLDIYFVVGLEKGVGGAALATVISQAFAGIGMAAYAFAKVPAMRRVNVATLWSGARMKQIIFNDLATGLQQSVMNFGILMIQGLVNSFGAVVMAGFAAAVKIDTLAYMPAQEFSNAYSIFVSQNYGAQEKERIKEGTRLAVIVSVVFCAAVSVFIFLLSKQLMGIFISADEVAVITEGARYLKIEGAAYIGIGILFLWYAYFRGINRPQVSLLLTIISLGTRVLLAYTLAPNTSLGVVAIWMAIPIGWALADLVGLAIYRK